METTVYTALALAAAVGSNDYDYIYLGDDIQISVFGISIDPNKTSLVIDGLHGGAIHTLEDANVLTDTGTIGVRASSNITLTFKNLNLIGKNYFGMPFISESANTSGVTVIYENVTYNGPQITYNPNGLTRYINCDITISYPTVPSRAQEVGEVNRVEFEGVNTITHTGESDAAFWFRGEIGTAYFKVLQDARVTISTVNYFMFSRTPIIPIYDNPVAYEICRDASLTLISNHGISYEPNHLASSFLMGTGASFMYIQETDNDETATLHLNGEFTVNEGASVYMQADFDDAQPLISFSGEDAQISINNPESFVLYNRSSSVIAVEQGGDARPFLIAGGQLNQWDEASSLPGAGDFEDTPDYTWHKPDWSSFSMGGNVTALSTNVSSTSFTPEELEDLPDPGDLSFQLARVVSIGNLPLLPDLVADDGRSITGYTTPGANIRVTYTVEGIEYVFEDIAEISGGFLINPNMSIPAGTIVVIESNIPFLITSKKVTVVAAADEIIIQRTPERIAFGIPPVSTAPDVLLRRINPYEAVEILDSRSVGTEWELLASIAGPLTTADGEVSANAVIFKDINDVVSELTPTPVVVYTGGPVTGQTDIIWPEEKGILVRVTEPIHSGVEYSTELRWELRIIP